MILVASLVLYASLAIGIGRRLKAEADRTETVRDGLAAGVGLYEEPDTVVCECAVPYPDVDFDGARSRCRRLVIPRGMR
jgi:hypothetical protein